MADSPDIISVVSRRTPGLGRGNPSTSSNKGISSFTRKTRRRLRSCAKPCRESNNHHSPYYNDVGRIFDRNVVLCQSKTRALSKGRKTRATDLLSRTMLTKCKFDRRLALRRRQLFLRTLTCRRSRVDQSRRHRGVKNFRGEPAVITEQLEGISI